MIVISAYYFLIISFVTIALSSDVIYKDGSNINVNEKFNEAITLTSDNPETPTSITNFFHAGANFFLNPPILPGNLIPFLPGVKIKKINGIQENINVRIIGKKPVNFKVPDDLDKAVEVTVKENNTRSLIPEIPTQVTKPTNVGTKVNSTGAPTGEEIIQEVIEPNDIITVSYTLQPVLKPEIAISQQLLKIPEAPMLPPLVLPEVPVKLSIEETIALPDKQPFISESDLYIPINAPKVRLLTKSPEHPYFVKKVDYAVNKVKTPSKFPSSFLRNILLETFSSTNKFVILIPTLPAISSFATKIPNPALYPHTIVEEPVISNMIKISEKTNTKSVDVLPIPLT